MHDPQVQKYEPEPWRGMSDQELLARIDRSRLPDHIAVIMDGNGRWAQQRNLPRISGHRAGIRAVREIVEGAAELGVQALTLFAFSTENWKRPADEIEALMELLKDYIDRELSTLVDNDIRFIPIGRLYQLPPSVQEKLDVARRTTSQCRGMRFFIALSYSGRADITDAVRRLGQDVATGRVQPDEISESLIDAYLYTAGTPEPDLLIRTSGELRISNFMLWQLAYTELWFTPILWPDFRKRHLYMAVLDFQKRERRYGAVQVSSGRNSPGSRRD